MKIATKTGDKGESGLLNGRRVHKSDAIFDVLGNLDELNSFLGWCKCVIDNSDNDLLTMVEKIQNDLYLIMGLAGNEMIVNEGATVGIAEKDIAILESFLEKYEKEITDYGKFIKPGSSEISARFHIARTVCRRAERSLVKFSKNRDVPEGLLRYLNRLSDLLFVVAGSY